MVHGLHPKMEVHVLSSPINENSTRNNLDKFYNKESWPNLLVYTAIKYLIIGRSHVPILVTVYRRLKFLSHHSKRAAADVNFWSTATGHHSFQKLQQWLLLIYQFDDNYLDILARLTCPLYACQIWWNIQMPYFGSHSFLLQCYELYWMTNSLKSSIILSSMSHW